MVVRMRVTKGHRNNRRSHHALKQPRLSKCANCGEWHLRHRMCPDCGQYRGRVVVDVVAKIEKKLVKRQARAEAMGASPENIKKEKPSAIEGKDAGKASIKKSASKENTKDTRKGGDK